MGRLASPTMGWRPFPFELQGAFLHICTWKGLLDLENKAYVVSLSFIWAGLSFSSLQLLSSSWSICPEGTSSSCSVSGPSISCLRVTEWMREWTRFKPRQVWFLGPHTQRNFTSCSTQNSLIVLVFLFLIYFNFFNLIFYFLYIYIFNIFIGV